MRPGDPRWRLPRHWIEQSYKQVKDQLGWADFQARSDVAIRRHQALVDQCGQALGGEPLAPGP